MIDPIVPFGLPDELPTPCLVVDLDRLRSNIDRCADAMRERGVALRPHAKTHKCSRIAAMQLHAGANGLTVATIDEAEAFLASGVDDIFIAYTVWIDAEKARRLRRLLDWGVNVTVGVDSSESIEQIARVMQGAGDAFGVSIEVDSGAHRCGVHPRHAGVLADAAGRAGIRLVGAFTHGGHAYDHVDAIASAGDDERSALQLATDAIQARGHETSVLSAGSTPTSLVSASAPVNEERPGAYVFGDRDLHALGTCGPRDVALMIASTVTSKAVRGQFVIDAGSKTVGREPTDLVEGLGGLPAYPRAIVSKLSEEHGVCDPRDGATPELGEVVAVVPNHVCPTVNLSSELIVVQGGVIVDTWPVDARSNTRSHLA